MSRNVEAERVMSMLLQWTRGKKDGGLKQGYRNEQSGQWQSRDSHSGPEFRATFFPFASYCLSSSASHHNLAIVQESVL